MRRPVMTLALLAVLPLACAEEEPSNLARLAEQAPPPASPASREPEAADSVAAAAAGEDTGDEREAAAPASEKITLALTLAEDTHYRVTTIGMTTFALVGKPTGFAREDDIQLTDCSGEGPTRRCTLVDRLRNFEAEPPLGAPLEREELAMKDLTAKHIIEATGHRVGDTIVEGPADQLASPQAALLAQADLFFCLSFPNQPVAVDEGWSSSCKLRLGGQIQEHTMQWKLAKLEEDPELGWKAELHFAAKVTTPDPRDPSKRRDGGSAGILYFLASHGEPHLLHQKISLASPAGDSQRTTIDMKVQFAKVSPTQPDELVRVDGKPFPKAAPPTAPPAPAAPSTPPTPAGE